MPGDFFEQNGYDPAAVQQASMRVGTGQAALGPDARREWLPPPAANAAGYDVRVGDVNGYGVQVGGPGGYGLRVGGPNAPAAQPQATTTGAQPMDDAALDQQIRQMYAQRGIPIGANDETNWIPLWKQRAQQGGGFGAIQGQLADSLGGSIGGGNPFQFGSNTGGFGGSLPGAPGQFTPTPFDFKFDLNSDPSYQFTLNEGLDALQRRQSSLGTGLTGGAMKDLAGYASGLASQEYGNQFNRALQTNQANNQFGLAANQNQFNQALGTGQFGLGAQGQMFGQGLATNQNQFNQGLLTNQNQFNQNFNLANLGLNSTTAGINGANGVANMATGYANSASNLLGDQGNAQAAGTVGSANARNQGYGNLANLGLQYLYGR